MPFEIMLLADLPLQKQAVSELMECNRATAKYGLTLTPRQAAELVETRNRALAGNGRIEFGGGVLKKLLTAFGDSPHILQSSYAETIHELIEIFYYFKNETLDLLSDDELIAYMKKSFDEVCGGSLELLADRELDKMARNISSGMDPDCNEYAEDIEEDEYGDE